MELIILGTGNATVTECYNTCFALKEDNRYFLVDGGGGNGILKILKKQQIPLSQIHDIFVSHGHTDHVLGIIWLLRMIGQQINSGKYQGELRVYCHEELLEIIQKISDLILPKKITRLFNDQIRFDIVKNGDKRVILGRETEFLDIFSDKMKQFGFLFSIKNDRKLAFCGDEPLAKSWEDKLTDCDWMLHEAFCLYEEREIFKPYEKHHATVREACETAQRFGIKNLLLYHTEDTHISERKKLYGAEGRQYYHGNLLIPDDGEHFELC